MASVSSATGLGNTSLRGYGGMASGIDRDALIEQMTLGTQTKITNKKNQITSLQWKQEAYQNVIDKILDMEDNYFSYSSANSLKDPSFFGKSQITTLGDSSVTKYINATGTSTMLDYVSILGVKQTAQSATLTSGRKQITSSVTTGISSDRLNQAGACRTSNLEGTTLNFGVYGAEGKFNKAASFTFGSTYYTEEGEGDNKKRVTHSIDYTLDLTDDTVVTKDDGTTTTQGAINREKLTEQLNLALKQSNAKVDTKNLSDIIKFNIDDNGSIQILNVDEDKPTELRVSQTSSALVSGAFGITEEELHKADKGFLISAPAADAEYKMAFNDYSRDYEANAVKKQTLAEYMTGKKISVTLGGQTKEIEFIKQGDFDGKDPNMEDLKNNIQERLDAAFGKGNVVAELNDDGNGKQTLEFRLGDNMAQNQTLTISSSSDQVKELVGIKASSNKLTQNATLADNWSMLGFDSEEECREALKDGLVINGKTIDVTADTRINEMVEKINSSDAGVKATFLSATNQFALIASDTGTGRTIDIGGTGSAAWKIFGGTEDEGFTSKDGQNAIIGVSYGNGITTEIQSTTNTFDLEGLKVTVSGKFGYVEETDEDGNVTSAGWDSSKAVNFSAKADVDAATERVKKFIEEYNALVSAVNTEISTKPDSDYGPLTDEQKDEMSETSIENWEKKAKQGLLFGDSNLRELSDTLQSMLVKIINSGVNPNDLEEIGISLSDDWYDGGELVFDETKFRAAMTNDPDKVADIICGDGSDTNPGLIGTIENSMKNFATRYSYKNNGSYGSLVAVAGSSKLSLSVTNNQIYKQLKQMQEDLEKLQTMLSTEQDSYISQFSTMETLISQMNSQSSYLSNLSV